MKLLEQEVFAEVMGLEINDENLKRISWHNGNGYGAYADCEEFIISQDCYSRQDDLIKIFKLTNTIADRWDYYGIDFRVYVYLKDRKVAGGHVFKYRETSQGSHFRPIGYEMEPTQQEIRITKRILEFVTQPRNVKEA